MRGCGRECLDFESFEYLCKGYDAYPSTQFLYLLKLPTRAAGSSGSSFLSFPQSLVWDPKYVNQKLPFEEVLHKLRSCFWQKKIYNFENITSRIFFMNPIPIPLFFYPLPRHLHPDHDQPQEDPHHDHPSNFTTIAKSVSSHISQSMYKSKPKIWNITTKQQTECGATRWGLLLVQCTKWHKGSRAWDPSGHSKVKGKSLPRAEWGHATQTN